MVGGPALNGVEKKAARLDGRGGSDKGKVAGCSLWRRVSKVSKRHRIREGGALSPELLSPVGKSESRY